jgi:comEA protein
MVGFTRRERNVLGFLIGCFFLGLAVQKIEEHFRFVPHTEAVFQAETGQEKKSSIQKRLVDSTGGTGIGINTATKRELESLPGIGPALAERIVVFRSQRGAFKTLDELLQVKGIGEKKLEKMRPFLTLN